MKIYLSETQDASQVSFSCKASMEDWRDCGGCKILRDDENVKLVCRSSHHEWNGRYGGEVTWKHDGTVMLIHVTGSGLTWGTIAFPKFRGNIILVPTANEGGSVHKNILASSEWVEISHPIFDGLEGVPTPIPMVPHAV